MSAPTQSGRSVLEFLEQLKKEREELNQLILGLERKLGIGDDHAEVTTSNAPKMKLTIDDVPMGFFHNLSQPQAAEKLLRLNPGQPLTTQDMLDAFRKSGMVLNPKNAATILYTALTRNPKFERVAKKTWGLSEWYPDNRRKSDSRKNEDRTAGELEDEAASE
jgi:hypothetical protein